MTGPNPNDSGNPEFDYLSDGMTDTLISTMARVPGLTVKSRGSVFRYKGRNVEPQQVASELAVQAVLTGRIAEHGDDVSLHLSLVDGRTGNEIWGKQFNRRAKDIIFLPSDIANDVLRELHLNLTHSEKEQLKKGTTQNFQLYYHRDWPAAERSFQRGLELNPESAEVHHHYGRCLYLFGRNEESIRELERTVKLEPLSPRYQLSLAMALYTIGDLERASDQIHKALELEPKYIPAHEWLGN